MRFLDRADAGKKLAHKLVHYSNNPDAIVIALPRGGVVTGFEIACALHIPLDIVVTRKIGAPGQPELAVGAITQDGVPLFNREVMANLGLSADDVAPIIAQEKKEAQRRLSVYRVGRGPLSLKNKIVILTDDGVATGATMRAAIATVRAQKPKKIILAIPVSPAAELATLRYEIGLPGAQDRAAVPASEVVCLLVPEIFWGVGSFYDQFAQVEDDQVIDLMQQSAKK